ncbi:MAG: hypothetical protein U9M90_04005 [Patescibacteria group bacterium]|nr:hypothetical protein [Patescibacteria group bacterium]
MVLRQAKRLKIIIVYAGLFVLLGAILYFMSKPEPSCSDGKRNQGETEVDCGGPCCPCPEIIKLNKLNVLFVEWIHDVDDKYDIVVRIKNSNDVYGAGLFNFRAIAIFSDSTETAQESWEKNFVLPGEEKSVFLHGFKLLQEPSDMKIEINEKTIRWQKFSDFEEPNFVVNNSQYKEKEAGSIDFGVATGTIINRSVIDFETVDVHIVLRDESGKLLAVNSQRMNTVRAGEFRDYIMVFPYAFPGSVEKVESFVETNPFDSDNYIKTHGIPNG